MAFLDKFKDMISPEEEEVEEEEYYEEPVSQPRRTSRPAQSASSASARSTSVNPDDVIEGGARMVLFEPREDRESPVISDKIKEGRAVVVNLHKLDRNQAQRTIDFLGGVCYALGGDVKRIGQNVILCYPAQVQVDGQIKLGQDSADDYPEDANASYNQ